MACSNALLVRYQVRIEGTPYQRVPIKQIMKVGGLTHGDEGSVSLRELKKIVEIPNTVRTLPTLSLQLRMDGGPAGFRTTDFFRTWYKNRRYQTYTVLVDITSRSWKTLYTWKYDSCSIASLSMEDQELGQTKLGVMDMTFKPYDVNLIDPASFNGTPTIGELLGIGP